MPFIDLPVSSENDRLRLVELLPGGQLVEILDLEDGVTFVKARDSFTITPGPRQARAVQHATRRGGQSIVGETHQNGTVSALWMVKGTTADDALANLAALLSQVESERPGRYLEWRPANASRSTLFEIRGPGTYRPDYKANVFRQIVSIEVEVSWPVAPSATALPMDVVDGFDFDSRDDYLFEAGAASNYAVGSGVLACVANPGTENSFTHTRGYGLLEPQVTVGFGVVATVTGQRAGAKLRVFGDSYLLVYVDDIGTNSRLRVDKVLFGVATNLVSTNLGSRMTVGSVHYVRGRIEGSTIFAEHFSSAPSPIGTPNNSTSASLVGINPPLDGAGLTGGVHKPVSLVDNVTLFESLAFTRRNVTLPATIQWADEVPGDLEAVADLDVTHTGGAAAPVWALASWTKRPEVTANGAAPFGVLEAETATLVVGWASQADGSARGGTRLNDTSPSSADTYLAVWPIDPARLEPDPFSTEVAVEVWGRVLLTQLLVSPRLTLTASQSAVAATAPRTTLEYPAGVVLTVPSSGPFYRMVKLGTLVLPTEISSPWAVVLTGVLGPGSGGSGWGVDYLVLARGRSELRGPTRRANGASYPKFMRATTQTRKVIRYNQRGLIGTGTSALAAEVGLGGSNFEPSPGPLDLLVKLSSLVPDDPTVDATSEQLAHTATVHTPIVPRFALARP